MNISKSMRAWLHGLGAAIVGGGGTGLMLALSDPEIYNAEHPMRLARSMLIGAGLLVGGYLKQSPLPAPEIADSLSVTASPSGTVKVTATHTETGEKP